MKYWWLALGLAVVGGGVIWWSLAAQPLQQSDKPLIVTTLFPLEDWTRTLVGEQAEVVNLVPDGVEPHDFEPTSRQLRLLSEADLVVAVGEEFDDRFTKNLDQSKVWRMSEAVPFVGPEGGESDPHVWLDLGLVEQLVYSLQAKLDGLLLDFAIGERAVAYIDQVRAVDHQYQETLRACQDRYVVVSHDAFGYLGRRYNLEIRPILGLEPEAEPNAQELAAIVKEARELKATTIFTEALVSPDLAQTLADELSVKTAVFNPAEGLLPKERSAGLTYLDIMTKNLEALASALRCD